jgi:predicted hotdog family 3-hydroxylacyl-ACP dehydratase
METILEKELVEQLLPQKVPFVMVDKMYNFTETSLVSGYTISNDNIFFNDGFFLESGLIEHMAQSVALHTGYAFYLRKEEAPTGYIGSIKEVKINRLPILNENIQTEVVILQEFAGITLVDIVTRSNDEILATSQMKTVLAK